MTEPDRAESALNLRTLLAAFGLVVGAVIGVLALRADQALLGWLLLVMAGTALVDLLVLSRRRAERARAHRGADHRHGGLFE